MANANEQPEQLDLFTRKRKACLVCGSQFWAWHNDKKCILCRSPMEDAMSIDITYGQMRKESASDDDKS